MLYIDNNGELITSNLVTKRLFFAMHGPMLTQVAPRTLPKTTSGKIRRFQCRERFLAHNLTTVPCVASYYRPGVEVALWEGPSPAELSKLTLPEARAAVERQLLHCVRVRWLLQV